MGASSCYYILETIVIIKVGLVEYACLPPYPGARESGTVRVGQKGKTKRENRSGGACEKRREENQKKESGKGRR